MCKGPKAGMNASVGHGENLPWLLSTVLRACAWIRVCVRACAEGVVTGDVVQEPKSRVTKDFIGCYGLNYFPKKVVDFFPKKVAYS